MCGGGGGGTRNVVGSQGGSRLLVDSTHQAIHPKHTYQK